MKKRNSLIILTICITLLFSGIFKASSFSLNNDINVDQLYDFRIILDPINIGANENVTAKILTYSFDTDISTFTWVLNGQVIAQGKGKKSIKFKTGNIGSHISITVSVITETKKEIKKTLSFKIGEVDLLYQALTHTPSFYKGKAMIISGSSVKIVAFIHGLGSSKNLIYEWSKNFRNMPDVSGKGKNSYILTLSEFSKEETIKVAVLGANRDFKIEKTITLKSKLPEVIFYEEHPLEGPLYKTALSKQIDLGNQTEIVIRAEPFFFPTPDVSSLTYDWTLNREPIESLDKPSIIGLSVPEGDRSGYAQIQLDINNPKKLIQKLTKILRINF